MSEPYVTQRFQMHGDAVREIRAMRPKFGFNGLGEFLFYRTYSRQINKKDENGYAIRDDNGNLIPIGQEAFCDTIIRVVEGTMSIRKNHYVANHIEWDEEYWQGKARAMAIAAMKMQWMPPGRGLWAMGTEYVYERGALALYNCAFTLVGENMDYDVAWAMDALMNGVGVGFRPERDDELTLFKPSPENEKTYVIPDSREGWCEATQKLIRSYMEPGQPFWVFDYSEVRPAGEPIRGFGGVASGPKPLKKLHRSIRKYCEEFIKWREGDEDALLDYDSVRLRADIMNAVGCCVVAGNVRRSAEISLAPVSDPTFLDLKNYEKHPERAGIGWMSNNSVILETPEDFAKLGEIASRVIEKGEPGYFNAVNAKFGRLRVCKDDREWCPRTDYAIGLNPCGEVPLEDKEVCNIAETLPTNCDTTEEWLNACEYAAIYCSTVSLLPTSSAATNRVVARNRRIGVGLVDFTGWMEQNSINQVTRWMRDGYKHIRNVNRALASEAGVPESIRVTTVKPGGTTPKLPGKTSGIGYPTFRYTLRRVRVRENHPTVPLLKKAGYDWEYERIDGEEVKADEADIRTVVFSFPIEQGPAKPATDISIWEQASNLALVQREWADNAVSNTLNFQPKWILSHKWKKVPSVAELRGVLWEFYDPTIDMHAVPQMIREMQNDGIYEDSAIRLAKTSKGDVELFRFNPRHEEDDIERVLSFLAPLTKSVSLMPHTPKGVYDQSPEEGITEECYEDMRSRISSIDWSAYWGSDGEDPRLCQDGMCKTGVVYAPQFDDEETW